MTFRIWSVEGGGGQSHCAGEETEAQQGPKPQGRDGDLDAKSQSYSSS